MNTVTGKVLRINLTDRSTKVMDIGKEWQDLYVGGRIGGKITL
mgnify:CR=1 FL=1|jgi:aldehyde:ferredoxin oxidoreductase